MPKHRMHAKHQNLPQISISSHHFSNCMRKHSSFKLLTSTQRHHLPIRVSHFFTVIDRSSSSNHQHHNKKLFRISSDGIEKYRNIRLESKSDFFDVNEIAGSGAVIVMKKTPTRDQQIEVRMDVIGRRGRTEGWQRYVYHVYVQ
jgi:hypothetical protein